MLFLTARDRVCAPNSALIPEALAAPCVHRQRVMISNQICGRAISEANGTCSRCNELRCCNELHRVVLHVQLALPATVQSRGTAGREDCDDGAVLDGAVLAGTHRCRYCHAQQCDILCVAGYLTRARQRSCSECIVEGWPYASLPTLRRMVVHYCITQHAARLESMCRR